MIIFRPFYEFVEENNRKISKTPYKFENVENMKKWIVAEDKRVWGYSAYRTEDIVSVETDEALSIKAREKFGWDNVTSVGVTRMTFFEKDFGGSDGDSVRVYKKPKIIGFYTEVRDIHG